MKNSNSTILNSERVVCKNKASQKQTSIFWVKWVNSWAVFTVMNGFEISKSREDNAMKQLLFFWLLPYRWERSWPCGNKARACHKRFSLGQNGWFLFIAIKVENGWWTVVSNLLCGWSLSGFNCTKTQVSVMYMYYINENVVPFPHSVDLYPPTLGRPSEQSSLCWRTLLEHQNALYFCFAVHK